MVRMDRVGVTFVLRMEGRRRNSVSNRRFGDIYVSWNDGGGVGGEDVSKG
jgi:hypothetical protein